MYKTSVYYQDFYFLLLSQTVEQSIFVKLRVWFVRLTPLTAFMLESFLFFSGYLYIYLHFFFSHIRILYVLSNVFLSQFSSYNLFILWDICIFKKVGHIIIYERWTYYQDFYFHFSHTKKTTDTFKHNVVIHLCHEYQFDDKICSLQKQLQILYLAKDLFFDFLKVAKNNNQKYEKFENTKGVISISKSKDWHYNGRKEKGQTLHRKLRKEQQVRHKNRGRARVHCKRKQVLPHLWHM